MSNLNALFDLCAKYDGGFEVITNPHKRKYDMSKAYHILDYIDDFLYGIIGNSTKKEIDKRHRLIIIEAKIYTSDALNEKPRKFVAVHFDIEVAAKSCLGAINLQIINGWKE